MASEFSLNPEFSADGFNIDKVDSYMTHMLSLMSQSYDLSSLAENVVKQFSVPYLPLKKVLCSFLTRYSDNISDVNILVVNSVLKDFDDANPHIRRLALKTACSLPCLKDISLHLLKKAFHDPSLYVRHTAVCYCPKVVDNSDASCEIIDELYSMIRSSDAVIASACFVCLDEILQNEGGIAINHKMFSYLISRISSFPEWNFGICCKILKMHSVSVRDVISFLNALDSALTSKYLSFHLPASDLALSLMNEDFSHLKQNIIELAHYSLLMILNIASSEVFWAVMNCLDMTLHKNKFKDNFKLFLCNFSEATYLKLMKIKMLPFVICHKNTRLILEELNSYCTQSDDLIVQAVFGLTEILKIYPELLVQELRILLELVHLNKLILSRQIMMCFTSIKFEQIKNLKKYLFLPLYHLSEYGPIFNSAAGIKILLYLMVLYSEMVEDMPYFIEIFTNEEIQYDQQIYLSLLTATFTSFIHWPAKTQHLIGRILKNVSQSPMLTVNSKAMFYYNSLRLK